ncbi:MAG: hypothetical protein RL648_741 [Verrucomicrobiota bacterium]|jgi:hypothetical protein
MSDKKERYIPSIRTLKKAAESLPPAQTWRADTVQVPVNETRLIEFKKIRFKTKEGKTDRWVYEGKLIVS